MDNQFQITLPKLGESIVSATVIQWFKKEGDPIQVDEPLLEVSTDKVNSEIPSPVAGVIEKIIARPDQEMQVGEVLAVISLSAAVQKTVVSEISSSTSTEEVSERSDFLSPAVLRLAQELNIALEELKQIKGSGSGGRITKQDLEAYAARKKSPPPCSAKKSVETVGDIERLKMSGMRKAIAENMVRSFYEAPHATLINEVDVTSVLKLIQEKKEEVFSSHGAKLTVTSFVARAVTKALGEYPLINSSLDGDTILLKRFVNLGIAVSIDHGLIVPVMKNCQKKGLIEMAQGIQDLSQKARAGKLAPEDVTEGTISLTNFGMSGVSIGVPIIRYPEVAIIGIGAIKKSVKVLDNDAMAIRSTLHISLTFDHRVLDGMYGCGFLSAVQRHLESDLGID